MTGIAQHRAHGLHYHSIHGARQLLDILTIAITQCLPHLINRFINRCRLSELNPLCFAPPPQNVCHITRRAEPLIKPGELHVVRTISEEFDQRRILRDR